MRLFRGAVRALPVLVFLATGCATVMDYGPRNGSSAAEQRMAAANVETALVSLRPLIGGRAVSVRIPGKGSPAARYVRECLKEMAASGGRGLEDGGDVRLEIQAVAEGAGVTERNLMMSTSSYVRIPLYYSERFEGQIRIAIRAFDAVGKPIPMPSPNAGGSAADVYLFRLVGPVPGMR